jgi:hypothetical protein
MADEETYGAAVASAQRLIEEWIETAKEPGRPFHCPSPGSATFHKSIISPALGVDKPVIFSD